MSKSALSVLAISILVILGACSPAVPLGGGLMAFDGDVLQSGLPRITSLDMSSSNRNKLVNGNSAFVFDLYQELKKETDDNFFYSPYSISLALAMTYAGAWGETKKQMADTLHFKLNPDKLHNAFNWLDQDLSQRGQNIQETDSEVFTLNITNAIWMQNDYKFLSDFLDILSQSYGAGLRGLDFINKPEESRIIINEWVSEQTEGRIKDLIPPGAIDALTRLVLTNTIYFYADWQHQFNADNTSNKPFYLFDGSQVTVPMMWQTNLFKYTDGSGYQAIELPYVGGETSMVIILPDEGKFDSFENSLDAGKLEDIISGLDTYRVTLTMPKFEFSSDFSLKPVLSQLGMPIAFSDGADFSGMTGNTNLYIGDVIHQAFVCVDESGTEAAAATAVVVVTVSLPEETYKTVTLNIDRLFIFLIRDVETNTILFVGRVLNPEE